MSAYYIDNSDQPGLLSGWTGAHGNIGRVNTNENPIPVQEQLIHFLVGIAFYGLILYFTKKLKLW